MCTFNTDKIYLTWRKGAGYLKHIVGVLYKHENNGFYFRYFDKDSLDKAKQDGFLNYPSFPDYEEIYQDALEVFKRRLPNPTRHDYDDFLDYWCAKDYKDDYFALLGLTGAKLQTDNFEVIAPHYEVPAVFYTELAGLHHINEDALLALREWNINENNDLMYLNAEPDNQLDDSAVKVFYKDFHVGYIKIIHNYNISKAINENLNTKTTVKNIIKNGMIKEVLLRIEINEP